MRVLKGYALNDRSTWNDDQAIVGGHGTHTSGSIVGNGVRSGSDPSTNLPSLYRHGAQNQLSSSRSWTGGSPGRPSAFP
jgi:hypothetical protein